MGMDYLVPIIGVFVGFVGILSAYHIAVRQGVFHKHDVLFTLSQPTLFKKGDKPPRYAKVRKLGKLKYPESYPDFFYPFMLKMPLIVVFGTVETKNLNAIFLPMTVVNYKAKPVPNVTINISMPDYLMPDKHVKMEAPSGITVERTFHEAAGVGEVTYELSLKPYDCLLIPELIVVDPAHIITQNRNTDKTTNTNSDVHLIRCVTRVENSVYEEHLYIVIIEENKMDRLVERSIKLCKTIIDKHINALSKPLFRRVLGIPYGDRTLLCIIPGFSFPVEGVAQHTYGKAGDITESEIFGLIKQ